MAENRMPAAVRRHCKCRRNAAGAGIAVPMPGRQKRGPCCIATWLDRRLGQCESCRRVEAARHAPFRRSSRLKKPEPGASAGCANLVQLYSIFDENARRTYHIISRHVGRRPVAASRASADAADPSRQRAFLRQFLPGQAKQSRTVVPGRPRSMNCFVGDRCCLRQHLLLPRNDDKGFPLHIAEDVLRSSK
jgi:hypothetical protein